MACLLGTPAHVDDEESRAPIADRLATLEWHLWPPTGSQLGGRGDRGFESRNYEARPGDWTCSCGAKVFAFRSRCYKCNAPKPTGAQQRPNSEA